MGFASFVGRVLFASVFVLAAWVEFNEFGTDGGPAAEALSSKMNVFSEHVLSYTGLRVPDIEIGHLVAAAIVLNGAGGLLFIFGSSLLGAYLLLLLQAITISYDFYSYKNDQKDSAQLFTTFMQNLALFGALLFFVGMKNSIRRRQHKKRNAKAKAV